MTEKAEETTPLPNFDPFNEQHVLEALAEENADILKRSSALKAACDAWDKVSEIKTDEQAEKLTTFLAQINNMIGDKGTATVRQKARKQAYSKIGDAIYKYFKENIIVPLEDRKKPLSKKLGAFLEKKKAAAEAEEARLKQQAHEAAARAQTAEQVEDALKISKAAGVAGKASGVKTDFGQGAYTTTNWKFKVIDISKVPPAYMQVNAELVNKVIKGKDGLREIPGLEIYPETTTTIRT